jgi:hypothetical protein
VTSNRYDFLLSVSLFAPTDHHESLTIDSDDDLIYGTALIKSAQYPVSLIKNGESCVECRYRRSAVPCSDRHPALQSDVGPGVGSPDGPEPWPMARDWCICIYCSMEQKIFSTKQII